MRPLAGLATALICASTAHAAAAQSLTSQSTEADAKARLNQAAFAPRSFAASVDPGAGLIEREAYAPGEGPVLWETGAVKLAGSPDGPVDSLRVSVGGALRLPG